MVRNHTRTGKLAFWANDIPYAHSKVLAGDAAGAKRELKRRAARFERQLAHARIRYIMEFYS